MLAQESKFLKFLWYGLAISFPAFCHQYFRLETGPLKASIPLFFMGAISVTYAVLLLKSKTKFPDPLGNLGYLLSGLLLFFLSWHFLSLAFFDADALGYPIVAKLIMGYFFMFVVLLSFPIDRVFLENFWCVVFLASAIVMGIFIYQYYVVFNSPFLSNNWEFKTREGRNQLTWYLIFILPLVVSSLWGSRHKKLNLLSSLVLFVALFYAGSRSALISVVLGIIFMVFLKVLFEGAKSLKKVVPFVVIACLVATGAWFVIVLNVDNAEMVTRFETLAPGQISNLAEDSRYALLQRGLDHFYSAPFTGIGLGQSGVKGTFDFHSTHNDYLLLLAELGIPGLFMFFAIVICIFFKLWPKKLMKSGQVSWVFLAGLSSFFSVSISLFFINAYETPLIWIYIGLILVGSRIENSPQIEDNQTEKSSPATGFSSAEFTSERFS